MPTRPSQGGSAGTWGTELNAWLDTHANADGTLKASAVQAALGGSLPSLSVDPRTRWLGASIARMLTAATESFGIACLTDSTANAVDEWVYLTGAQIAAAYPAYTALWYLWDDASQDYVADTTIQTGTGGIARHLPFVNGVTHTRQLVKTNAASVPTDLDVAVKVALDDWTPASQWSFAAHSGGAGDRGWWFQVETSGLLSLVFSNDGTALITKTSTVAPVVADGGTLWVRVVLDVDNGAGGYDVKFYTSTNGATWTQLGATVTTAVVTTLFDAVTFYEIGGRGTNTTLSGKLYEVRIRNGIAGPLILPAFPEQWMPFDSSAPEPAGAPVLAIVGGSMPGQGLTYLSDATRLPKLLRAYSLRAVLLSTSHNDGYSIDKAYLSSYSSWITAVKTNAVEAVPVVVTQNPKVSPVAAQTIAVHAKRREKLLALAQQLGYPSIDGYQGFLDASGVPNASLIQADGIHPTVTGGADGSHAWRDVAYTSLFGA